MLIACPECSKQFSDRASACPECAWPVPEKVQEADSTPNIPIETDPWKREIKFSAPWTLGSVAAALLVFFLFFHVVMIQGVPTPVRRISLSLSEPFVDMAEISGMPWITATSKYPLTVKALQNAGLIESDQAREQRIQREIQSKADAEYDRIMNEMKEQQDEIRRSLGY